MAITDLCTNAETNVTSTSTTLRVPAAALAAIKTALNNPSHLFAELYSVKYSEQIMIYGYETVSGVTVLDIQRGMGGTSARSWPDGVCIRILSQVNGTPCGDDTAGGSGTELRALLDQLNIGQGLELIEDANGLTLRIANSGALAGEYGGATVASTGQLTHIPTGWPASAVPAFETCCSDAGDNASSGTDITVSGIEPDGTGNIDLCGDTASDVPVTNTTPVFICSSGAMAKTTVGRILALVPDPDIPDVDGMVKTVGGLSPDDSGAIDFDDAALISSTSSVYAIVSTGSGIRRMSLSSLMQDYDPSITVTDTYDPNTATYSLTINGSTYETVMMPAFDLSLSGRTITMKLGATTKTIALPEDSVDIEATLEVNASGKLALTINGDTAEVQLQTVTAVPINTNVAGITEPMYRLVRTTSGSYYFIIDTTPTSATTVATSVAANGTLTTIVNGTAATAHIPVLADLNVVDASTVSGTKYRLVRTASGEHVFIEDV